MREIVTNSLSREVTCHLLFSLYFQLDDKS